MKKALMILLFIGISAAVPLRAQVISDTTAMYAIETTDGNDFTGNLISRDSSTVVIWTPMFGRLKLMKQDIKKMVQVNPEKIVDGKLWFENPQSSRYFWAPNGYGLHKGEGYYQNIWVLWNQASYGFTEHFSLGAGIIPLFFFGEGEYSPVWIVPKLSVPIVKDKFNVGIGAIAGKLVAESHSGFGILYGTATLGNRNNNFSLGLGYGYLDGDFAKRPIINISFMSRVGPRGYLISENYYLSSSDFNLFLISLGGRSFVKKVGIDYGLFLPLAEDMDAVIALPWLGFTVPINKKK